MKALILSGGAGTRLRPLTYSCAKQLLPIANKPILYYGIEAIASAGIKDFAIIVGDTADTVMAELGDGSKWGINITYIKQEAPLGLAHAVKISKDFMKDDPFIMFLGDNLLKEGIPEFVQKFNTNKPNSLILLTKVKNPQQFGVAEFDKSGNIKQLVEKPKEPKSNFALVGIYLFDKNIFKAVDAIKPSARGELEITDAIQWLLDNSYKVEHHEVTGWWKDTGKPDDLIEANRLILEEVKMDIKGNVDAGSELNGEIAIGKNSTIVNSKLSGPIVIGDNCVISDSQIGSYTSVGSGTKIYGSRIENSIIMEDVLIRTVKEKIAKSIIGRGVQMVSGNKDLDAAHSFVVGDNSQIEII